MSTLNPPPALIAQPKYSNWPARPALGVRGETHCFPLSRVFGVGRNYADNPKAETKVEDDIVLFTKDAYSISNIDQPLKYPDGTTRLRYEVELVVAIGRSGRMTSPDEADAYIFGYGVGIDFTKYDVQDAAKRAGRPWDSGKSFPGCAPCSELVPASLFKPLSQEIWLDVNDKLAQSGFLDQMIWTIPELLFVISNRFELRAGDLIFTGTPEGVGMVERGQRLSGGIEDLTQFAFDLI
jgi:fumarylpyruvate hydrolase